MAKSVSMSKDTYVTDWSTGVKWLLWSYNNKWYTLDPIKNSWVLSSVSYDSIPKDTTAPKASVDWRSNTLPVLTPVKNQGSCGSCWAFSGTTALEANIAINMSKPAIRLSEQEWVSCATNGCYGCNGGWYPNAWRYTYDKNG